MIFWGQSWCVAESLVHHRCHYIAWHSALKGTYTAQNIHLLVHWKDLLRCFGAKLFYIDQDSDIIVCCGATRGTSSVCFWDTKPTSRLFLARHSIGNATIGHIYHSDEAGSCDISLSDMFRTVLVMDVIGTSTKNNPSTLCVPYYWRR